MVMENSCGHNANTEDDSLEVLDSVCDEDVPCFHDAVIAPTNNRDDNKSQCKAGETVSGIVHVDPLQTTSKTANSLRVSMDDLSDLKIVDEIITSFDENCEVEVLTSRTKSGLQVLDDFADIVIQDSSMDHTAATEVIVLTDDKTSECLTVAAASEVKTLASMTDKVANADCGQLSSETVDQKSAAHNLDSVETAPDSILANEKTDLMSETPVTFQSADSKSSPPTTAALSNTGDISNSKDVSSTLDNEHNKETVSVFPLDCCDESGLESFETASRVYGSSVTERALKLSCAMCGVLCTTSRQWLLHHFEDGHRKITALIRHFRDRCIEHVSDDVESKFQAEANALKESVPFTQELFEVTDKVFCGVCVVEVNSGDFLKHITSLKHNNAYLNILYAKDLAAIKLASMAKGKVKVSQYNEKVSRYLAAALPRTDHPLEVVVLQRDPKLVAWLFQFLAEIQKLRESAAAEQSYVSEVVQSTDKEEKDDDIQVIEEIISNATIRANEPKNSPKKDNDTAKQQPATDNATCQVCRLKHFTPVSFKKHIESSSHMQKVALFDFFNKPELFSVESSVRSAYQKDLETSKEPLIGAECIYDFRQGDFYSDAKSQYWACVLCYTLSKHLPAVVHHLASSKHRLNYVEDFYSDVKPQVKDTKVLNAQLKKLSQEIIEDTGLKNINVAVIAPNTTKILESIFVNPAKMDAGKSACAATSESTISSPKDEVRKVAEAAKCNKESKPNKLESPSKGTQDLKPKILLTCGNDELIWCEFCHLVILVDRAKWTADCAWKQHLKRGYHLKKCEIRQSLQFSETCFVQEGSIAMSQLSEELKAFKKPVVGLNGMIERINCDSDGTISRDMVCILCAEVFPLTGILTHLSNRIHLYQFIHKNYPEMVRQLFFSPAGRDPLNPRDLMIEKFVADKNVPLGTVRVYDNTKHVDIKTEAQKETTPSQVSKVIPKTEKQKDKVALATLSNEAASTTSNSPRKEKEKIINKCRGLKSLVFPKPKPDDEVLNSQSEDVRTTADHNEPVAVAGKKDVKNTTQSDGKTEKKQDPLVKLLMNSNVVNFGANEKPYIQSTLDQTKEPLIGLEQVFEFVCIDPAYEPGYLCRLCVERVLAKDCLKHIITTSHRLNYLELNYKSYYQILMPKSATTQNVMTKQYAANIEKQEGRKAIRYRLSMKVDRTVLHTKKPPVVQHTVHAPLHGYLTHSAAPHSSALDYSWNPAPPGTAPTNSSPKDSSWDDKTAKFLRKLDNAPENRQYQRFAAGSSKRKSPEPRDRLDRSPKRRYRRSRSRSIEKRDRRRSRSSSRDRRNRRLGSPQRNRSPSDRNRRNLSPSRNYCNRERSASQSRRRRSRSRSPNPMSVALGNLGLLQSPAVAAPSIPTAYGPSYYSQVKQAPVADSGTDIQMLLDQLAMNSQNVAGPSGAHTLLARNTTVPDCGGDQVQQLLQLLIGEREQQRKDQEQKEELLKLLQRQVQMGSNPNSSAVFDYNNGQGQVNQKPPWSNDSTSIIDQYAALTRSQAVANVSNTQSDWIGSSGSNRLPAGGLSALIGAFAQSGGNTLNNQSVGSMFNQNAPADVNQAKGIKPKELIERRRVELLQKFSSVNESNTSQQHVLGLTSVVQQPNVLDNTYSGVGTSQSVNALLQFLQQRQ